MSHVMDDGSERPIATASRTLTKTERGTNRKGSTVLDLRREEVSHMENLSL